MNKFWSILCPLTAAMVFLLIVVFNSKDPDHTMFALAGIAAIIGFGERALEGR